MEPTRTETDSMGAIEVPADALWGAQTARSLRFFAIGEQHMPLPVIQALALVKWAAAGVNHDLDLLDKPTAFAIAQAALLVAQGEWAAPTCKMPHPSPWGRSSAATWPNSCCATAALVMPCKAFITWLWVARQ